MNEEPACRVAICAELDPGLADGVSIWAQAISQVLGWVDGIEVTVLLQQPDDAGAARDIQQVIWASNSAIKIVPIGEPGTLSAAEVLEKVEELEGVDGPFDFVVVRGKSLLATAAARH